MPNGYIIQNSTLTGIANQVRNITNTTTTKTPSQITSAINTENTNLDTQSTLISSALSSANGKSSKTNNDDWLITDNGADLTTKCANEIANFSDPWQWIKSRITNADYRKLNIGDYIPFTTTNNVTFKAQIAGIDTYYENGYSEEIPHHIDFISKELWRSAIGMNKVNFNNGTSAGRGAPWVAAQGYFFVNSLAGQVANKNTRPITLTTVSYTSDGIYNYLPDGLKAVITAKYINTSKRFNSNTIYTKDIGSGWISMGKLWLPDEIEITGERLLGTRGIQAGGCVQYPLFAHSMNRIKSQAGTTSPQTWFTSTASVDNSTSFVAVDSFGNIYNTYASEYLHLPICFRIAA